MAQVNQRIGELDRSLQDYTQLVFDSRLSENDDTDVVMPFSPSSSQRSAKHKRKGNFLKYKLFRLFNYFILLMCLLMTFTRKLLVVT